MAKIPGNSQLLSSRGEPLRSLKNINQLDICEKELIYASLIPVSIFNRFNIDRKSFCDVDGNRLLSVTAPENLGLLRMEIRRFASDRDPLFFLDLADTQFHQMELAFCMITDPQSPRFDVDINNAGEKNYFASMGRNISEEKRSLEYGLFPHQVRRGLRLFGEFFDKFERFVDSLGIEIIIAEPLTYDNAIRYEKYGFEYLTGKLLMNRIKSGFKPGGELFRRLDGSTPFRNPEFAASVRGRSWAIHDGIMDEQWDDVSIYKMVGSAKGEK